MAEQERRAIAMPVECRKDAEKPGLSGYAAVFGSATEIAGMFREQIAPGAFRDAVGRDDVRALFNHDSNYVLGRTAAGTLRLVEDDKGLRYDVDVPDTQWARDLMVSVARGDVSQSSFAFVVTKDEWDYTDRAMPLRTIQSVELYDVSPVTYPAYAATSVSARAAEQAKREELPKPIDDSWKVSISMSRERCRLVDAVTRESPDELNVKLRCQHRGCSALLAKSSASAVASMAPGEVIEIECWKCDKTSTFGNT